MRKIVSGTILALLITSMTFLAFGVQPASANVNSGTVVLTFDDLIGEQRMPEEYGCLTWDERWWYYDWEQPPYYPNSPPTRLYWEIANAPPSEYAYLLIPEGYVFEGAYFSGYDWATVQFEAYDEDGNLIGASAILAPTSTPTWLAAGFEGARKIVIASPHTRYWVIDDITLTRMTAKGWGVMWGKPKGYVRGPAELYIHCGTEIKLVITFKDEEYSKTWEIRDHYMKDAWEIFECYNPDYGPFKVKINGKTGYVQAYGAIARFTGRLV